MAQMQVEPDYHRSRVEFTEAHAKLPPVIFTFVICQLLQKTGFLMPHTGSHLQSVLFLLVPLFERCELKK